jgi:hypothetical protein
MAYRRNAGHRLGNEQAWQQCAVGTGVCKVTNNFSEQVPGQSAST